MKRPLFVLAWLGMALMASPLRADDYQKTIDIFQKAGESAAFFDSAYGYAVFPSIGKGGIGIGGAYGKGRVFEQGKHVGDCSMKQATVGFQLGGQAFRQIVFFQDQRAFKEFTSGRFAFGAEASAVGIKAGASAKAGTAGTSAGASSEPDSAKVVGKYHKGMATFTVAKGGLMYEASIGGQKFSYKAR